MIKVARAGLLALALVLGIAYIAPSVVTPAVAYPASPVR
jgi:hypothetical protein